MRRGAEVRVRITRFWRSTPLVVTALLVLLALLVAFYYLIQRSRGLPDELVSDQVLLFALRNLTILLIAGVLFVCGRYIFKAWLEDRAGHLGSRFRTKLVFTHISLALLPVLALSFFAYELLQSSVERWFSPTLRVVLEQAGAVAETSIGLVEERARRDATQLARRLAGVELGDPAARERLDALLREQRELLESDYLGVYLDTEFVHGVADPRRGLSDLPEPGRDLLRQAIEKGAASRLLPTGGGSGRLVLAAAIGRATPGAPRPVAVSGVLFPPALAGSSERLLEAYQRYRQIEVQKQTFKNSYQLLFVTVTLLILLSASWVGLHLASRVMGPLEALEEGTRRIREGDYEQLVEVPGNDEVAVLVDSFNRMTSELKRSREAVEHSHRELREANRRLAEERALVAAVLESVAAGVVSVAGDGVVLTCNHAALAMLHQRRETLIGRRLEEAWADPERAKLARLAAHAPAGVEGATELRLVLDGEWRTFEAKASELRDAAGLVTGRVLVLEDLTELERARKLAAWSEAARRVAHEIKNPLTPIRLAAERIVAKHRQGSPDLGETLEEGAETIVTSVTRLQAMVDEFSRFARMPQPQPRMISLASLAGELLPLYAGIRPEVEVRAEVPGDLELYADPDQLRRVLINLLDNAIEATEGPGEVVIAGNDLGERVAIEVRDSGRGIPAEQREKVFLPFYSTKGRGTGLGLAIVLRIVADHNGVIQVADNAPAGTIFRVELPRQ
ncbi:MAG: PAS domain-containing protein [Thermoanaerobaculia bacterium]|nr:PAS domain-containing protein [Thermoanaerobaculia bacterium]MBP7812665.1 PAS domain-containing protein [Thermoanaerobaculia bacterium]MBP8844991.1 PAS domain-containing protein [Thermoanaerobaculia bacterium]HPA95936.1 ATP-binding protein [Thermoanaerobaculia bacterium]HRR12901.1 ATP-binding protein [Thermoanaerobaculia bacterium]